MLFKNIVRFVSFIYLLVLFYIVFIHGQRHSLVLWKDRINIMPAKNLIRFYRTNPHQTNFYITLLFEIFGNIILFMPFGFLLSNLWPNKRWQFIVLCGCLTSSSIEITQLLLQIGICDIDDIILNAIGAAIGIFVYKKMAKQINKLKNY